MGNFSVYIHISPNNKKYVGITSKKPEHRWNNGKGYIKNKYFYDSILKYGWINFQHIVVAENLSKNEAFSLEKALISGCKTTNPKYGYNMSKGGESGTYGIRFGSEYGQKIRERMIGNKNPNYGKKFSDETRMKLSMARKGKWSDKQKAALTNVHKRTMKPIICLDTGIIYESLTKAAKENNIPDRGIGAVCRGEQISSHGLHWSYYTGQSSEELFKLLKELKLKKENVYKTRKSWNKGLTYKTGKQKHPCKDRKRKNHD